MIQLYLTCRRMEKMVACIPLFLKHFVYICVRVNSRTSRNRYLVGKDKRKQPWVWCGSSHNTLVIHWRIDAGREVLSDGCVRTATSSEVPATRVLRQCGVGWVGDTESAYMAEDRGWKPSPPFVFFVLFFFYSYSKKKKKKKKKSRIYAGWKVCLFGRRHLSLSLCLSLYYLYNISKKKSHLIF